MRKAVMITAYKTITNTIKERVTIPEALIKYGYTVKPRIPCPIHGGKGDNFEVKERAYICYSRCGGGDVISLVIGLYNLSFPEACKKLDEDFALSLFKKRPLSERIASGLEAAKKAMIAEKKKEERNRLVAAYEAACDEFVRLDNNYIQYKPKSQNEPLHPLFVEALSKLETARYNMDEAQEAVYEYDRK